jgi:ubiquinone/menaquinone biosynthesis C-methylase UbiE
MRARTLALGAAGAVGATAAWWRRNPSACPYNQRFWVQAPHPLIPRERLRAIHEPRPGERLLEVGPGTGYYALDVAAAVAPGGTLALFDIQQKMLDHAVRRAAARGIDNVEPTRGDARELPYPDASCDGAYLVTVLGEIPPPPGAADGRGAGQEAALRELARVLRPSGRLVVGELLGDPHYVPFGRLRERASAAGLRFERRVGGPVGYFARFAAA